MLRNGILARAVPGSKAMLDELLRRAREDARRGAAVPSAPADADLRDRIAEALMRWAERGNSTQYATMRRPETVVQNAYSRADAVLAALPAPVDRAAVLREAADAIEATQHERDDAVNERLGGLDTRAEVEHLDVHRAAAQLRRMADEAQQNQTDEQEPVQLRWGHDDVM